MDCTLLGSGGMMPLPNRFLTSVMVRLQGKLYLFDAGEGCQISLKKAKLGIKALRVLAVSHLHGDHCLGIPGILMMRAQVPNPGPLTILGPCGIKRFVHELVDCLNCHLDYPISFVEWSEGCVDKAYEDDTASIYWAPLQHTSICLGYRLEEPQRPGRFDPEKAQVLGVPRGSLWGRLQHGETVSVGSSEIIPSQVLGPPRKGRTVCYAVDTEPCENLYRLCQDADIAFVEGMFLPEDREEASAKGHMTVEEAIDVGLRGSVRKLVLVHISPRYTDADIEKMEHAVRERFESVFIGRDLQKFVVQYSDP